MRHLQKLFSGLRTISEVMEKYLLSPEDLLLLPEFVYMDMATGEYSFIYYPERMGEENTSFRDLNEFFMQHMDSENILLVEAVYQMTVLLNRQQFVLDDAGYRTGTEGHPEFRDPGDSDAGCPISEIGREKVTLEKACGMGLPEL